MEMPYPIKIDNSPPGYKFFVDDAIDTTFCVVNNWIIAEKIVTDYSINMQRGGRLLLPGLKFLGYFSNNYVPRKSEPYIKDTLIYLSETEFLELLKFNHIILGKYLTKIGSNADVETLINTFVEVNRLEAKLDGLNVEDEREDKLFKYLNVEKDYDQIIPYMQLKKAYGYESRAKAFALNLNVEETEIASQLPIEWLEELE